MKPFAISAETPNNIENDFNIDWENLLINQRLILENNEIKYLQAISQYCNNGGIPKGIYAQVFDYQLDSEFERLLNMIHHLPILAKNFIPFLFAKTKIAEHLQQFSPEKIELQNFIYQADFQYLNSFEIAGELSKNLYYYGMYQRFCEDYSPNEARKISLDLMNLIFENDLENVLCFTTRRAWGKWFDIHSCTDYTFVFLNKKQRKIWLFCFSHSD
jgi:hypothetical protein